MLTFTKGQIIKVIENEKEIGEVIVAEVVSDKVLIVKDNLNPDHTTKFGFVKENDSWFVLFNGIWDEPNFNKNFPYTLSAS